MFHGGSLEKEFFGGRTWWTPDYYFALDYAANDGLLYATLVHSSEEDVCYANESDYDDCETSEDLWEEQARQVDWALKNGYSIFEDGDGFCLDHKNRKIRQLNV